MIRYREELLFLLKNGCQQSATSRQMCTAKMQGGIEKLLCIILALCR